MARSRFRPGKRVQRRSRKSREWQSDNLPKTEQHIPTADIGGTNSRMEQAKALKHALLQPFHCSLLLPCGRNKQLLIRRIFLFLVRFNHELKYSKLKFTPIRLGLIYEITIGNAHLVQPIPYRVTAYNQKDILIGGKGIWTRTRMSILSNLPIQ